MTSTTMSHLIRMLHKAGNLVRQSDDKFALDEALLTIRDCILILANEQERKIIEEFDYGK